MGRMEELFYELYASSKQHDSRQRYAMIVELRALMKQPIRGSSGSVHSEGYGDDRRFGGGQFRDGADDDDDALPYSSQLSDSPAIRSKQLDELHLWLRSNNAKRENRQVDAELEEESIPQFQVPIANSEIVRSIEPGKVDLGLENEEYVVLNGNLEQEWDQKVQGMEKICSAHKVFVKMPSKEKCMKHLKAWRFKFKPTSKRSRLMDDMFSFVEETALLKKDPKETIWDCARKGFKETMAACGKKRVDRFKLLDETSKPAVYDRPFQIRVWDSGGSPPERVDDESSGDDKSSEVIATLRSLLGLTSGRRESNARQEHQAVCEQIIMVNVWLYQISLVLQQVMRSKNIKFPKRWMFKYKASNLETKVTETSDQCTRNRVFVSANRRTKNDQPTMRSLMNTKQSCLSLRANRVWDPGGSLVDAATPRLLSLHFTVLHLVTAILSSLQNLEVKVSSKEGDLIQENERTRGGWRLEEEATAEIIPAQD